MLRGRSKSGLNIMTDDTLAELPTKCNHQGLFKVALEFTTLIMQLTWAMHEPDYASVTMAMVEMPLCISATTHM